MRLREAEQLEEEERRGGVARGGGEGDDEDRLNGVLVRVRVRARVRVRVRLTLTLTLSAELSGGVAGCHVAVSHGGVTCSLPRTSTEARGSTVRTRRVRLSVGEESM